MTPRESYPAGVSCYVDTERADVDAAAAFYAGLFGWSYAETTPAGAPDRYLLARLDELVVAGIGSAAAGPSPAWNTYVSVERAEATAERVEGAGGRTLLAPMSVGEAGRIAIFADPQGAAFRIWEPGRMAGSELVNAPGTWNWSNLETSDLAAAQAFYRAVFGWEFTEIDRGQGPAWMIRVPGYGEHLEALTPGTLASHRAMGAPEGFSDAIGWMQAPATADGGSQWAVTFSVADTDAAAVRATELGGAVLVEPFDVPYVRMAVLRDPDGATFTTGQFKPPA